MEQYAKADVKDFPAAILNVTKFYNNFGLCPIKDAVSIPSLSIRLMERLTDDNTIFFLPGKNAEPLLKVLKAGIIGTTFTQE